MHGPDHSLAADIEAHMRRLIALLLLIAVGIAAAAIPPVAFAADAATRSTTASVRKLSLAEKAWTGDFDRMVERRMIRVAIPYSRTLYFNDAGRERGLAAELARDFERYVNQKYKTGKRPLTVYIVPTTRDQLLPKLASGLADIAAGNLTITPDRLETVDFVAEGSRPVKELVVTGAKAPPIASVDDLAGRTVLVRPSSSYHESLVALNEHLRAAGKPEVTLQLVPDALEDEDMMEMANAGLIDVLIVDDWKARMWAQILPNLRMSDDVFVREGGRTGWAIRKGSPKLAAAIEDFHANFAKKQAIAEYRLSQAMRRVKQIKDPTKTTDFRRFQQMVDLFQRYGDRYGFDPLMLAAQGYQESQLNQEARSHVGAIGVMQLMPATGEQMKVGNIHVTEPNIHAGTKYMDLLMTKYFPDAHFSEGNRPLFAFAAYNCGPGNIARMRAEATKRGLDPDKWFNNVELVVAEKIGIETTTYVRNIYKYYVTYKLTIDAQEVRRKALEELTKGARQ
jgi:membrane-bound lytic murein transglycosylase MltF